MRRKLRKCAGVFITFFIKLLQHKNNPCRCVGRIPYADLSHAALDTLAQPMSKLSLCWICAIFAKRGKKREGSGFRHFLNTLVLMAARRTWVCSGVLNLFSRLEPLDLACVSSQTLQQWRCGKEIKQKAKEKERQEASPFQMKTQTVLHKTWHKHPPSAPLQNPRHNKTREPELHCSFIQSTPWLLDKQETIAQHPFPWHQGLCHRHTLKQCLNMQM